MKYPVWIIFDPSQGLRILGWLLGRGRRMFRSVTSIKQWAQVLGRLDPHAGTGAAGVGRSSSAEAAAKAMTARTAGSVRVGKSASIFGMGAPSARLASTVRTVTRVPFKTGSPPHKSFRRSKKEA